MCFDGVSPNFWEVCLSIWRRSTKINWVDTLTHGERHQRFQFVRNHGTKDDGSWLDLFCTLPETNGSPLKIGFPKRKVVFQPSIFRCYVSFREGRWFLFFCSDVEFRKRWSFQTNIYIYRYISGQIIATSHDLGPQKVAEKGKFPYFREI